MLNLITSCQYPKHIGAWTQIHWMLNLGMAAFLHHRYLAELRFCLEVIQWDNWARCAKESIGHKLDGSFETGVLYVFSYQDLDGGMRHCPVSKRIFCLLETIICKAENNKSHFLEVNKELCMPFFDCT